MPTAARARCRAKNGSNIAFEHVNRRGVELDMPFVRRAAALAAEDAVASGHRLNDLTGGTVTRVTQAKRIAAWLHDQLPDAEMREVLTVGVPADDNDGDDAEDDEAEPQEFSLTRDRVGRILALLEAKRANGGLNPDETAALEVATLRLYGAGASPKKFARLEAQQVNGTLRGQYRFAGAGQTGRMTSRGAQIQNLARDVLGAEGAAEAPLVDAIADGCSYAARAAAEPVDVPVARKLALLVRPALIAKPGCVFVWSDWSAIEARITPWLAASPDAERVLDIFRANDSDPSRPDIYTVAAADILHKNDPSGITKSERNVGKVATLALGFGGSVGALQPMALNYRISLDNAEARRIVDAWRGANPWAREFWGAHRDGESYGLWGAAMGAWEVPGQITTAGRIGFVYRDDYLGGALFMALPSGRLLTYRRPRWRDIDILDRCGKPTGEKRSELSFRRAHGRAKLWHGTLCLADDSLVLTEDGWLRIDQLGSQRIWDGEDFVVHGGVICNGLRHVIDCDGVAMTPDHLILTTEGWKHAREGYRFDRAPVRLLTVLGLVGMRNKNRLWFIRCQCGREWIAPGTNLTRARGIAACQSCSGKGKNATHGMSRHPAFAVWRSMKARCQLPTHQAWHNYGGRGISVCDRWLESFANFWEDMGPTYRRGLTIERINNMGDYAPENCTWETPKAQALNKRTNRRIATPWGEMAVSEASERSGIGQTTIFYRLARTSDLSTIFSTPDVATSLSSRAAAAH
jgi:hypothetical protein